MRFGRWSAPRPTTHHNVSGSMVEATRISNKPIKTKSGGEQAVAHRKERSRYDIPEPKKQTSRKVPAQVTLTNENLAADIPIIDRIPTAIGYLSDESEEEWLEEKSRCSRYEVTEHKDLDDDFVVTDMEEEENRDDDDVGDDGDDKYSQNGAKVTREKSASHRDTISALWSHSTDSDTDKDTWNTMDANVDREAVIDDHISYAEEKGADPIYDKNQGKQKNKKKPKSPNSPAGISETSSMSDNLQKMLHFAPTDDEAVTDIEDNIQALKAKAVAEFGTSIQDKKISTRKKPRRAVKPTKISKRGAKSTSKDQIELSRSVSAMAAKSRDEIELSRTVSVPEPKEQSTKGTRLPEKPGADDFTDTESAKSGRQSLAMYTKSLLTEDSDNDTLQISILPNTIKPSSTPNVATIESRKAEVSRSRNHRIGILLSNSWNFPGTARTKAGNKDKESSHVARSKGFFSKMRKQRKANIEKQKDSSINDDFNITEVNRSAGPLSPRSKGSTEPKELDEYSRSTKEANQNEPDVVQCLRYFQCGTAANHVNVAISVANCGTVNDAVEEEEENDVLDVAPGTPKQTVEVYLNGEQTSNKPNGKTILSCGSSMSCKNEAADDDDITDVPGLGLSRASSIIIDVTGMQLHLDGDTETDRKFSPDRGVGGSHSRSDMSVTSITVPVLTSTQSEANEENEGKTEETELELKDYMNKINKRKWVPSFLKVRFAKKH